MKSLLPLLFLIPWSGLTAQVYYPMVQPTPFPTYEEVLNHFYRQYQGAAEPKIEISKRQDGFHVTLVDDYGVPQAAAQQIWTPKRGWQAPVFVDAEPSNMPVATYDPEQWQQYVEQHLWYHAAARDECDRQPFFGYAGFYNDVIRILEPKLESLNNQQLHSLARAYSFASSGLLNNNSGYADSTSMFRLPTGQKAMDDAQLDQYKSAVRKAVAAYDRLQQRDPEFETPIGPARTKYANEIVDSYLILLYFQDEKEARTMLKPGLYDDFLLQTARNMLASCPKDAVLFAYGDSDTYLPLYVQAMENFRTDVTVANLMMLHLPRYCNFLYHGAPGAASLKTSLPDAFFRELFVVKNMGWTNMQEQNAADFFKNLERADVVYEGPEYKMLEFSVNKVMLPPAPDSASIPGQTRTPVYWNQNRDYFYADALVLLDIAASNAWSRPLCFSTTCIPDNYTEYQNHLALEGLVYRLYPNQFPKLEPYSFECPVSEQKSVDLWKSTFRWVASDKPLSTDKTPFYQSHWYAGLHLALHLKNKDACQDALTITEIVDASFTDAMQPRDYSWISFVDVYASCGKPDSAERLGLQIWENYKSQRLPREMTERTKVVAERLREIGEKYGLERLKNLP
ncbi:MAG: hypothetical protein IT270_15805 [Saprospiraceae bacterium]|nr:hypothetical protein [Saprospiraceae bacterium]